MKACVLEKLSTITYKDVPTPKIKDNEVLVKVKACGICSSDMNRVFGSGAYHYPIILGHEIAGEVVDTGKNTDKSYNGKKVVVFPLLPCFECEPCKEKLYAQCSKYNYFGSRCDGGFAEYMSVPIWNIKLCPENLSFEEAVLCEPAAVALHSARQATITNNSQVLIIGNGLIGIILGYWAKNFGADVTFLVRNKDKEQFISQLGFKSIYKETNQNLFDVCFECVGSNESINNAVKYVKTKGEVILTGNPKDDIVFEKNIYWKILRQEITVKGIWNSRYPEDWEYVLNHIEKLPVKNLITHRFKLSDGISAFNTLKNASFKIKGVYVLE